MCIIGVPSEQILIGIDRVLFGACGLLLPNQSGRDRVVVDCTYCSFHSIKDLAGFVASLREIVLLRLAKAPRAPFAKGVPNTVVYGFWATDAG